MRLLVVCASALLLATCASAFMQGVTFPSKYEVSATFSLPYADIQEPIYTWYDADNTRQRIDYYGGVNSNLYRGDLNISYSITPTGVNRTTCFYQDGQPQLTSLFPDLTAFTQQTEHVTVNGVKCVVFQYIKQEQDKINTYNFYVSETDNTPVRYHMMGYDTVFSSHYDEYVLDYLMLKQGVDDSAFAVPQNTSECIPSGTSPGPSMFESMNFALHAQPHTELAHLHPTSALHQETVAAARQHVVKMFHAFRQQYKWQYAEAKEVDRRATVFGHNLRFVNSHNRAGLTYRVALNHLAATTSAERARRLNPMRRPRSMVAPGGVHTSRAAARDAPTYFNWVDKGAVSPVKDQGDCGSCWTFGSSQSIEGALFLKTGQLVRLSSQALVDCSWDEGNAGCGGGLDFQAYNWIMKVGGIPAEADYPYIMINGRCTFDKGSVGATAISSYVNVTQFDEDALMDALITKGPISVSIDASRPGFSFYSSGVFYDPQCRSDIDGMDHSVLLTGFGTDATAYKSGLPTNVGDYWIVKNSWSTYWGDQGYVHMSRANNNCGVATEPTYVVIADTKH